ncbi:ribosome biogenesis GTPase YqeH [Paenibacillus sp. N1-5-1-14]|uniref:ribosome biogenesis GTPase YqeH n=1 Tax=Paenibacillus radicibacter TaxID=2972488 RepID=UPI002159A309|nr:ribosome biogenesis GTPase YqeH [Paenibacillus radicibacter]MCR8645736.1 ribosome biogenesis GTPase YqeH [Paenibacillus radicibacter]
MSEEVLYCAGCGVKLQLEDPSKLGFVPEEALLKEPVICQRCYRIKHYNESSSIALDQDDFLKILGGIGKTNSLVVNIVDIFDFEGSMISGLQRFVGNNPIILVVNKIDLLPKVTNYNRIVNWVQKHAKQNGLRVVDVVLCSAKRNMGFDRVIESLGEHRGNQDIYVVGATNVGKSTLINRLISDFSDLQSELTTSSYPGTTLDLVKIPLEDGKYIVDTPGIVYKHRLTELISRRDLGKVMPSNTIKPMIYQLNEAQTLFIGALARFDFIKGDRQSFTFYIANSLKLHRTKLDRADDLYAGHKGELLTPPSKDDVDNLPSFVKQQISIPRGKEMDILISGLGWIKINSKAGAEIAIHAPKGVKVVVRESLI